MYRIMMIAPTPFFADRGCHVRILGEIQALQALGHKVVLCTYHLGRDIDGVEIRRIINIPWYRILKAGPSYHKYYLDFLLLLKAFWTALKFNPDIIHAHLHEGAFIGLWLKKLTRIPLVFDLQGSLTDEIVNHKFTSPDKMQYKLLARLEKWIDNGADAIIASSTSTAENVHRRFLVPAHKIRPVIDGVNADIFKQGDKNESLLEKYGIPRDKKIILYLGLLDDYQGTDLLLEAIQILKNQDKSFHAVIAGYPNVRRYRRMASELNISELVTFTDKIHYAEAANVISLGDIAVSPKISLTEGNQKICNYMACKLPVIAFETPVNREILGDSGVYAQLGDSTSLAENIKKLLDDEQLRMDIGHKVRERVQKHLSWESSARRILEVYRDVTKTGKRVLSTVLLTMGLSEFLQCMETLSI